MIEQFDWKNGESMQNHMSHDAENIFCETVWRVRDIQIQAGSKRFFLPFYHTNRTYQMYLNSGLTYDIQIKNE